MCKPLEKRVELIALDESENTTALNSEPGDERFIRETGLAARVASIIEPVLVGIGYRLVRVAISKREGKTLQIMAEKFDGSMAIEDCQRASRAVSAALDVEDLVEGTYNLEMSSPGIDRPLVRISDFERWAGYDVKIELVQNLENRRRFKGRIVGLVEDGIELQLDDAGTRIVLPFSLIGEAKLVLTDELIEESLHRSKQAGDLN